MLVPSKAIHSYLFHQVHLVWNSYLRVPKRIQDQTEVPSEAIQG